MESLPLMHIDLTTVSYESVAICTYGNSYIGLEVFVIVNEFMQIYFVCVLCVCVS